MTAKSENGFQSFFLAARYWEMNPVQYVHQTILRKLVEHNPLKCAQELVLDLSTSQSTICRHLRGCLLGVIVKALDCRLVVRQFELQLVYYIHFRTNTLRKVLIDKNESI